MYLYRVMDSEGNCHDNAIIEFFYPSLKSKLFYSQEKATILNTLYSQINHSRLYQVLRYGTYSRKIEFPVLYRI